MQNCWEEFCLYGTIIVTKTPFLTHSGSKLAETEKVDGRSLRGARNRQALLDAAIGLMEEGTIAPAAQEIAERAGVGLRGIFRHFGGMEGLFAAVNEQVRAKQVPLFGGGNREGSFRERLLRVVEQRALAYEKQTNAFVSVQVHRWRSPYIKEDYANGQIELRRDLENWLPELANLPSNRREAVDANASFETWYRLREHQNLSVDQSVDIVYDTLKLLITQP